LSNHQTRSYDAAVAVLDELLNLDDVKAVEDWEQMARAAGYFRYPSKL
jgi:hypothetical protein